MTHCISFVDADLDLRVEMWGKDQDVYVPSDPKVKENTLTGKAQLRIEGLRLCGDAMEQQVEIVGQVSAEWILLAIDMPQET